MAEVTLPNTLTAGETASAADVMADLNAIVAQVNGGLDATNLEDGAVTSVKAGQFAGFSVYRSAPLVYTPNTTIVFDADEFAPRQAVRSGGRMTMNEAGIYMVTAKVEWQVLPAGTADAWLDLYRERAAVNSRIKRGVSSWGRAGGVRADAGLSSLVSVAAGDILELRAWYSEGAQDFSDGLEFSWFQALKVGA